jgi:vacuolar-type H+-ATPase subunit E/Vma4
MKLENILPYKLNLQFFAEGEGDNPGDNPSGEGEEGKPEVLELTPEELQKKIESESDRKLAKVLERKQKEWEQQFQERLEKEKKEAERLAKLSERERKEEELRKREEELQERLRQLELKELKADAIADLNNKGLPAEFADFLLAENAEKTLENINNFKQAFDKAVNEAVKEKLRQDTPPAGGGQISNKNPFSKEHLNLTEQGKLIRENPEQAKQLMIQAGVNPAKYGL